MFWYIDPAHSSVSFKVKHMMVSTVRGRLGPVRGRLQLDPDHIESADFEIAVDVAGVYTGDERRDGHLRSGDFFAAEQHPEIVFRSNAIFPKGSGRYTVSGDLTIRGVKLPASFEVELEGIGVDAQGGRHLGASASTTIDRIDFGLTWNMPVPNGVLVGEKVKVEVDLQALDEATAKSKGLAA